MHFNNRGSIEVLLSESQRKEDNKMQQQIEGKKKQLEIGLKQSSHDF